MSNSDGLPQDSLLPIRRVYIVGFAPSWEETPWDVPGAEYWGLNALHRVAGDRPWTRWFQLHDVGAHHKGDDGHVEFLHNTNLPVFMFPEHADSVPGGRPPTLIPYPTELVLSTFENQYFNNSISWMIALAIVEGFDEIYVYGVDMAQDTEYMHQRPSVEFFLGYGRGMGKKVFVPESSDLLKVPYLYGLQDEETEAFRVKMNQHEQGLFNEYNTVQQQIQQLRERSAALQGAIETTKWVKRAWMLPTAEETT